MKKQFFAIMMMLSVLFSNLGLSINMHYCEGELENISIHYLFPDADSCNHKETINKCCTNQDDYQHQDCCKDETFKQKIDNQIIEKNIKIQWKVAPHSIVSVFTTLHICLEKTVKKHFTYSCNSNPPPLYKLYKQYLFYN